MNFIGTWELKGAERQGEKSQNIDQDMLVFSPSP